MFKWNAQRLNLGKEISLDALLLPYKDFDHFFTNPFSFSRWYIYSTLNPVCTACGTQGFSPVLIINHIFGSPFIFYVNAIHAFTAAWHLSTAWPQVPAGPCGW